MNKKQALTGLALLVTGAVGGYYAGNTTTPQKTLNESYLKTSYDSTGIYLNAKEYKFIPFEPIVPKKEDELEYAAK